MNRSHRSISPLIVLAATLGVFDEVARPDDPPADGPPACGTIALFGVLRFSGRDCSIDEVSAALPGRDPRGHSLAELREGASRLGLDLEGIRLRGAGVSPDRPMIAFVERGGHGHFVAIRPVGHTGRLVQILDGLVAPEVRDMGDLVREPGWTGLGLISRRPRWAIRTSATLAASASLLGLAGIASFLIAKRRRARVVEQGHEPLVRPPFIVPPNPS